MTTTFKDHSKKPLNDSRVNNDVPTNLEDWISQAEAARIKGVSQERIRQLVQEGRLQSVEVAGRKLVRRSEVEAFVPKPEGRPPKKAAPKKRAPPKKPVPPKKRLTAKKDTPN